MPYSPFHLGFAWPVWLLKRKKLHFMSLSIGSMIPDIGVLFMTVFYNSPTGRTRGFMHSIMGALTFDILAVMFAVFFIVPPIGRYVKAHSKHKWHIFAGEDVTLAPTNIGWALVSAYIGTTSHLLLDYLTHEYNPIFWPYFTERNMNWQFFGNNFESSVIFMIPLGIIALVLALRYWTRPFESR